VPQLYALVARVLLPSDGRPWKREARPGRCSTWRGTRTLTSPELWLACRPHRGARRRQEGGGRRAGQGPAGLPHPRGCSWAEAIAAGAVGRSERSKGASGAQSAATTMHMSLPRWRASSMARAQGGQGP